MAPGRRLVGMAALVASAFAGVVLALARRDRARGLRRRRSRGARDHDPVGSLDDLRTALEGRRPGDEVEIELWRGDGRRELELKLGRRPPAG